MIMTNEKVSVDGEEKHAAQWAPAGCEAYYPDDGAQDWMLIEILLALQNSLKHSKIGPLKGDEFESVKKFCFTDNYEKISNWCN